MYKWKLCLRYLRTRWIALASIVSVTLGVATMIVVNSVMEGFSHEMEDGIHDLLSDVLIECQNPSGFPDARSAAPGPLASIQSSWSELGSASSEILSRCVGSTAPISSRDPRPTGRASRSTRNSR